MTRRRTGPRTQIIGWLAQHATTRVGPRGGQVQVPVEQIEAVTVRHYTSRAGDPHRHLHLQINARVFAAGQWRGLHTVGVRDSLGAINGIGHAAVMTDPQFRSALAAHGFTLDPRRGRSRSWPRSSGRSVPGRRRSHATSTATKPSGRAAHPGETARAGAAASVGCAGVGRRPPGQGHPAAPGRTCTPGG